MTLATLKKSARASAEFRGHKLSRFKRDYPNVHYACCTNGECGMGVWVNTRPAANEIDISGNAVALTCLWRLKP